jgi:hypothetical protein
MLYRRLLLLVTLIFAISSSPTFAKRGMACSKDSIIVLIPQPEIPPGTGPRSDSSVPILAGYDSSLSLVYLYFKSNLGDVEVALLNTSTAGYYSDYIDTRYLYAILPITLGPGHYIITFTLPSGQQYQGGFNT